MLLLLSAGVRAASQPLAAAHGVPPPAGSTGSRAVTDTAY
jgi:hypothetical protein